ncbi:unnamed protein product [Merluccius merluccius]
MRRILQRASRPDPRRNGPAFRDLMTPRPGPAALNTAKTNNENRAKYRRHATSHRPGGQRGRRRCRRRWPAAVAAEEEEEEEGGGSSRRCPFIGYLSALLKTQLLSEDLVNGVEIRCGEKGSCPPTCHLCHAQTVIGLGGGGGGGGGRRGDGGGGAGGGGGGGGRGRGEQQQPSPVPVLLEVSRVVPLYSLVQGQHHQGVQTTRGFVSPAGGCATASRL